MNESLDEKFEELFYHDECSELRNFLDENFYEFDINRGFIGRNLFNPLQASVSVDARHDNDEGILKILLEYGIDVQSVYPHIVINGLAHLSWGRYDVYRNLRLMEDVGDYCLCVDEAYVVGMNVLQ